MRVSFLAFARALTVLPLLFVPIAFSQTEDCKIIDSPAPCVQSGINHAECAAAGTCGTNCPSPPAPGPSWINLMAVAQDKVPQCAEDVIAVASAGKGYYEMFGSRYAEGLYSGVTFFSGTKYKYCNFNELELGGFIRCSSCGTYGSFSPCENIGQHPASCTTTANCIPQLCPVPSVGLTASIVNPCGDPFVICRTYTDADGFGVFGNAACSYLGYIFLDNWGFSDCDGRTLTGGKSEFCPTF
jgi:hypothetical protein